MTARKSEAIGTSTLLRRRPAVYDDVRDRLQAGDIALSLPDWRPSNHLIAWGTQSPYVHAAMIGWCNDVLMLAEARQWRESHLVTLSSQVKRWPGLYDVYRVRKPFSVESAWGSVVRATGTPYGWGQLIRAALRKIFGRLVSQGQDDPEHDYPRDCSALVNFVCRAGGRAPRPDLPDAEVEPGHFADPGFSRYVCTLFWTKEQVQAFEQLQKDMVD